MESEGSTGETRTETKCELIKFRHKWTINNFSFCKDFVQSSVFTTSGFGDEVKWSLKFFSLDIPKPNEGEFVVIYLYLENTKKPHVNAKIKISLLNAKNKTHVYFESDKVHSFSIKNPPCGFFKFISRDTLLKNALLPLPDDRLTILCEGVVHTGITSVRGSRDQGQFHIPECRLLNGLGISLESEKFSDVTLTISGREFRAHKVILAAASPVFAAMFEHEMAERERDLVEIKDIDDEALTAMLRFIYTGQVPDLKKMAGDLLPVADKYDLKRLKVICERELFENLTIENAAYTLQLADLHHSDLLKKLVIELINTHTADVMHTAGFKAMVQSHPHLVAEL